MERRHTRQRTLDPPQNFMTTKKKVDGQTGGGTHKALMNEKRIASKTQA